MWVWSEDSELVNLGHVEFIRVEQDEEGGDYEVRAYPFQLGEADEELYYVLASDPGEIRANGLLEQVVSAMAAGKEVLDLRGA